MTTIDSQTSVGALVAERPSRSRVFESLGIDYCCGGKKSLADVCRAKGLDPASVIALLAAAEPAPADETGTDWATAGLAQLCDHIEQTHHAYLKRELPRMGTIVRKVAAVHGEHHFELREINKLFMGLSAEMTQHMMKEEHILFPMIRRLETAKTRPSFHCGSVGNPIRVMEHEHDSADNATVRIRQLTGDYAMPPDGCESYRAMLDGLSHMETDLHQHIHKENNILFPRAIALESRLGS